MTARYVRVVQNVPFSPSRTFLENDIPCPFYPEGRSKPRIIILGQELGGALSVLNRVLHQRTIGCSIASQGAFLLPDTP